MQVLCKDCGFSGMFDPARAPDHAFTIMCPKCGRTIPMPGKSVQQPEVQQPPQAVPHQHSVSPPPNGVKRIDSLLNAMVELKASDLHVSSECPPMVRKDGEMSPISGWSIMSGQDVKDLLWDITPLRNRKQFGGCGECSGHEGREGIDDECQVCEWRERRGGCHDTDYAYEISGLARFRVNIFMDRKGAGAVFRVIPSKIITAEDLNLSKEILNLCNLPKGLVLVTGPTGSGKSTTLCAMVDYINRTRKDHMITIEDPIEFVHDNKGCLINQREVHEHTMSFKNALRAALREDPDIVYVGEMRDLETISIAIETAETGHLVFGTLHTSTAPSTVDRIIDQFPGDKQEQIRMMLSESLRGVICQMLCKKIGGGRIAAMEVLIVNHSVANLIREKKTFQIQSVLQTGKNLGMCTMNDSLLSLVRQKIVAPDEAYDKSIDKAGLVDLYKKHGIDTSWV